jgi:hypothetical protein
MFELTPATAIAALKPSGANTLDAHFSTRR